MLTSARHRRRVAKGAKYSHMELSIISAVSWPLRSKTGLAKGPKTGLVA